MRGEAWVRGFTIIPQYFIRGPPVALEAIKTMQPWSGHQKIQPRNIFPTCVLCYLLSVCLVLFLPATSSDGTARLWDCGSAHCLATLADLGSPINACALASSVLVAEKNTIPPTGQNIWPLDCIHGSGLINPSLMIECIECASKLTKEYMQCRSGVLIM